jgi:hypothetical protein
MKSQGQDLARALRIARDCWDVPVRVRLEPYVEFIRRLDGELEKLVARWAHTAAADALGLRRRRR